MSTGSCVSTLNINHQSTERHNVLPFPPPSLVVSTMTVPQYQLGVLSLCTTVQSLAMHLGDDQEGSIWLVLQLPQLIVRRRAVLWVGDDFHPIITFAPGNIQHIAIKVAFYVEVLETNMSLQIVIAIWCSIHLVDCPSLDTLPFEYGDTTYKH